MTNERPGRIGLAYYQAACLTLLLIMVGFSIVGVWGLVGLASPVATVHSHAWRELNTRSQYLRETYQRRNGLYYPSAGADTAGVTPDEVTERWRDMRADALALERHNAAQRVLLWLIALAVCLPLYAFHHRVVARAAAAVEHDGV